MSGLKSEVKEWQEIPVVGNLKCPLCGQVMVIMTQYDKIYGFCIRCLKYFVPK